MKFMIAAAVIAAGLATLIASGSGVDAATAKKKVYKTTKVVVYKPTVPKRVCSNTTLTGGGMKKGLAGTEKKVRVLAIADWERQARARFGAKYASWATSSGKQVSCKRDVITVRCLAISTPCTP